MEVAAFAAAHHKPLSFPEWATVGSQGDDAAYVTSMARSLPTTTSRSSHGSMPVTTASCNSPRRGAPLAAGIYQGIQLDEPRSNAIRAPLR
jgi:hypothetical protein